MNEELKCPECGNTNQKEMKADFHGQFLICVKLTDEVSSKSKKKVPCFTVVKQLVDKIKYTR